MTFQLAFRPAPREETNDLHYKFGPEAMVGELMGKKNRILLVY